MTFVFEDEYTQKSKKTIYFPGDIRRPRTPKTNFTLLGFALIFFVLAFYIGTYTKKPTQITSSSYNPQKNSKDGQFIFPGIKK